MLRATHALVGVALLIASTSVPLAAAETPSTVAILFESRHLDHIAKGAEVTYRFERKVSNEKMLGAGFADDIKLGVTKVNEKGDREVEFKVFTNTAARDPSSWPDLTINPIFIWYLDRAVANFGQLAGGNHPYLKQKFREALRDKAAVESVKFNYNGKDVDAYRVTLTPYAGDPSSQKMQGFENARFTIVVSNDVPGYFADLVSAFESQNAGAPRLEEHISLVGMEEAK
jgi:hypothetical protein